MMIFLFALQLFNSFTSSNVGFGNTDKDFFQHFLV